MITRVTVPPVSLLVCVTLLVSGCYPSLVFSPEAQAWDDLRSLYWGAARFEADQGHLPEDVAEMCPPETSGRGCEYLSSGRMVDPWGNPNVLSVTEGEFIARSMGPDSTAGTADDIVLSSEWYGRQVQAHAGCYRGDFTWWNDFEGDTFRLYADSAGPGAPAHYPASPDWYSTGSTSWHPLPDGGMRIVWQGVEAGYSLRLLPVADSLVGVADEPGAWGGYQRHDVVFERVECPPGDKPDAGNSAPDSL